jgi:biopolymer transport protein ExbB/TolQ
MSKFTLQEMILSSWHILSILWVMSIFSVTVMADRWLAFRKARLDLNAFIENLINVLRTQGLEKGTAFCKRSGKPAVVVALAILSKKGDREARERACRHAMQGQINKLEYFITALGTIAATAPLIGLFGTVTGIIKSFQNISGSVGGGPEVVAGGVAEALITTAFGLIVAIPAAMAYNYFIRRAQRMAEEIDLAMYNVIEEMESVGGSDSPMSQGIRPSSSAGQSERSFAPESAGVENDDPQ